MRFLSIESTVLTLKVLLEDDLYITSLDGPKCKTMRIEDHIFALRHEGLIFDTDMIKVDGKKLCVQYTLVPTDKNIKCAAELSKRLITFG